MNKYLLSGIIAIIVIVGGYVVVTNGNNTDSTDIVAPVTNSEQPVSQSEQTEENEETAAASGYITYSEANLVSTKETKQVVFFHAPWCSTCIAFEKEIIAQGVPEGMTILKADFDNDTELKQKYGVRLQSTFVLLDANGDVEQSWPFGQGLSNDIANLYDQVI